jgi:ABC-type Fe3+ transport system permease subunit
MIILGVVSLFVAAGLSLMVSGMSIAILILKKRIVRRYGGYVVEPVDTEREERARLWIDRLLWAAAILSLVIALTNIGVAALRIAGKS